MFNKKKYYSINDSVTVESVWKEIDHLGVHLTS